MTSRSSSQRTSVPVSPMPTWSYPGHVGPGLSFRTLRFIVDRCAGRPLAEWLRNHGHDVVDIWTLGPDPGDRALLERAESENRVLVTIDKDFGELIYLHRVPHSGLIRLPDVRMAQRIALVEEVINHHGQALEERAIITVQGNRARISRPRTI